MVIEIESKCVVNSPDNTNAIFPGATRLDDGSLLLLFVSGSGFESSDQHMVKARSLDGGRSWRMEGNLYDYSKLPFSEPFTDCCKPTSLGGERVIAVGYGFRRDEPQMGLSDYAEKFGRFPAALNPILTSEDGGRSWKGPWFVPHDYAGLELSGPALRCADGRLLIFAAPFVLKAKLQQGFTFESCDGGVSWKQTGTFFSSAEVAPWEVRSVQLPSGRIVLVIWAYDLVNQRHLANQLVWSDDGGRSWSRPIDTGLRGQASNFLIRDGKLGIVQARREGAAPGIYLSFVELHDDSVTLLEEACIWDAAGMANRVGKIEEQFANLKFGQPSVVALDDETYLLLFWNCIDNVYAVQSWRFSIR